MKRGSSKLLLLDVNVLLAMAWPNHQFHWAAVRRLDRGVRWATCALTQLGFVRLSSNPAVVGLHKTPGEAVALLAVLIQDPRHVYLDSLPSPASEPFLRAFDRILGFNQVMDAYLLALAERRHATLVTFDTRLAAQAPNSDQVEVLAGNLQGR